MSNSKEIYNVVGGTAAKDKPYQQAATAYTANKIDNSISNKQRMPINVSISLDALNKAGQTSSNAALHDAPDLVCLSHLRWDFVYQRPQHLLSRCAAGSRVFFIEEPMFGDGPIRLDVSQRESGVYVVVPHLPHGIDDEISLGKAQQSLVDRLFVEHEINRYVLWYYTPMAVRWTRHLQPLVTVYDCMDELSAFKGASAHLKNYEVELLKQADLVFTGGQSLYEAKRDQHKSVHAFPSSVDVNHFAQARAITTDPVDQQNIPHPRLGFFGVIDERMDLELLEGVAAARPDWHLVMIGPVVKIDPATLPSAPNIHYLGGKNYKELPAYLAGWDVALLPFARNESTRFISPTKTPEYLAAGKPVVSTSIRDVVRPYGQQNLVRIADTVDEFVAAIEAAMSEDASIHIHQADEFLKQTSWDNTWSSMLQLIQDKLDVRQQHMMTTRKPMSVEQVVQVAAATGSKLPAGTNHVKR